MSPAPPMRCCRSQVVAGGSTRSRRSDCAGRPGGRPRASTISALAFRGVGIDGPGLVAADQQPAGIGTGPFHPGRPPGRRGPSRAGRGGQRVEGHGRRGRRGLVALTSWFGPAGFVGTVTAGQVAVASSGGRPCRRAGRRRPVVVDQHEFPLTHLVVGPIVAKAVARHHRRAAEATTKDGVRGSMSVDKAKQRERAQQVALFRYQLICPALEDGLSTKQRGRIVRAIAADREHDGPSAPGSGTRANRWTGGIRRYRTGGFEALCPSLRQLRHPDRHSGVRSGRGIEAGEPRPHRGPDQLILRSSTGWSPSETTLLRQRPPAGLRCRRRRAGRVRPARKQGLQRERGSVTPCTA